MATEVLNPGPAAATPQTVHNCPACGHWLTEGTLACPDCQTLAYGQYLGTVAGEAQTLEQQGKIVEARDRWRSALMWMPETSPQAASVQAHIAQLEGQLNAEKERESKWRKRLGPFAPIVLFLIKFKSAIFLLFKLKFLLGFLGFFALYWAIFGWKFAIGFMLSIFIHEMGHFIAVKRRGLKAELPMFRLLGAYVRWYHQGISLKELAAIALAGPLYGLGAALACLGLYWGTHASIFLVLANVGAWINLLNLVPLLSLDGAQATYALSRLQRGLIAATSLVFFGLTVSASGGELMAPQTQWVFAFVGCGMLWRTFFGKDTPEKPHTETMVYFLGLILALGFLLLFTAGPLLQLGINN
jgi:Zn-dependent protease